MHAKTILTAQIYYQQPDLLKQGWMQGFMLFTLSSNPMVHHNRRVSRPVVFQSSTVQFQ